MSASATPEPVIRQIVDAMRTLAGPHPGFRPVHAKGLVCSGTFRASADAPRVTRAPHFAGQPVPTVIRFANSNGNPEVHDGAPNVKLETVDLEVAGEMAHEVGEAQLTLGSGTAVAKYVVVWKKADGQWRLHRDIWNTKAT